MKKVTFLLTLTLISMTIFAQKNIYGFKVKDASGKETELSKYEGKVLLIVNTATECGFTPQYTDLEQMYEQYRDKGFEILDFPCNQFGGQAPGTMQEISSFCSLNYNTQFPLFQKIDVNGPDADPLFVYLKSKKGFAGFDLNNQIGKYLDEYFKKQDPNYGKSPDIKWNFTKFLINKKGKVVKRYEPTTGAEIIKKDIEKLLK